MKIVRRKIGKEGRVCDVVSSRRHRSRAGIRHGQPEPVQASRVVANDTVINIGEWRSAIEERAVKSHVANDNAVIERASSGAASADPRPAGIAHYQAVIQRRAENTTTLAAATGSGIPKNYAIVQDRNPARRSATIEAGRVTAEHAVV